MWTLYFSVGLVVVMFYLQGINTLFLEESEDDFAKDTAKFGRVPAIALRYISAASSLALLALLWPVLLIAAEMDRRDSEND